MSHECNECKWEIAECYCGDCLEKAKEAAYNEGYADAEKEFKKEE